MAPPTTYSEWVVLLDKFGCGDDTALEELSNAFFTIDAGTASRFYLRVEEAYKKRKQNWLVKFQRALQLESLKSVEEFEIALRNGKQNLLPLNKFVFLKGLPEDLRITLYGDLEDFVAEIKKSLKDNILKISSGREKMLILLNTFCLNDIPEESIAKMKSNEQSRNDIIPPTGRKIIL